MNTNIDPVLFGKEGVDIRWRDIARKYDLNPAQARILRQMRSRFRAETFAVQPSYAYRTDTYHGTYLNGQRQSPTDFTLRVSDVPTATARALRARGVIEVADEKYRVSAAILNATPCEYDDPVLVAFRKVFEYRDGYEDKWKADAAIHDASFIKEV